MPNVPFDAPLRSTVSAWHLHCEIAPYALSFLMKYHLGAALKHLLLVLGGGICGLGALGMRRLSSLVGVLQCAHFSFRRDRRA